MCGEYTLFSSTLWRLNLSYSSFCFLGTSYHKRLPSNHWLTSYDLSFTPPYLSVYQSYWWVYRPRKLCMECQATISKDIRKRQEIHSSISFRRSAPFYSFRSHYWSLRISDSGNWIQLFWEHFWRKKWWKSGKLSTHSNRSMWNTTKRWNRREYQLGERNVFADLNSKSILVHAAPHFSTSSWH